jgi:hypothetical protein
MRTSAKGLLGLTIASSFAVGCNFNRPWYVREYEDAEPHDKAVVEYKGHVLYLECAGTHYAKSGDVLKCGWLQQHVGGHLGEGEEYSQLTRLGSQVCYHDGAGGAECYVVVREVAQ